jgi:hypothetical protein
MGATQMRATPLLAVLIAVVAVACVSIASNDKSAAQLPANSTQPPPTAVAVATPSPTTSPQATSPAPTPGVDATATPPTAEPTATPSAPPTEVPTGAPTPTTPAATATANVDDPACTDGAFELEGFAWDKPYFWYFNRTSTPDGYDPDAVLPVLKAAFDNVTSERNDCGRPDRIAEGAGYQGTTEREPCSDSGDGVNVIGFGPITDDLSPDTIAYTCPFTFQDSGEIAEADIVIGEDIDWAVTLDDCHSQELLEPTITHEVGHVFGLGHVSEHRHGDLTMSTTSDGPCDDRASTLGLGDMLGLEQLYP